MNQQALLFGDEDKCVTIAEERIRLESVMWGPKATRCRCCHRIVKGYRRSFNSGMARLLIWLAKQSDMKPDGPYVSIPDLAPRDVVRGREPDKVEHWGFVERQEDHDESKRESGCWRVTELGIRFVCNAIKAPKYILVYNNNVVGTEGETTILEAIGNDFDYYELMRGFA